MESSGPRGLASLGYTVEVTAVESQKITIGIERSPSLNYLGVQKVS